MPSLHYLTVQDVLWINFQVTKKVQHFNFARLEEAVFYQYAYGDSNSLFPQAARFVSGFVKMHPFDAGNKATAFLACLAFIERNGYEVTASVTRIADWFSQISGNPSDRGSSIADIVSPRDAHRPNLDVESAVQSVLDRYCVVVDSLSESAAKQSA